MSVVRPSLNLARHIFLLLLVIALAIIPNLYRPIRKGRAHPVGPDSVSVYATDKAEELFATPIQEEKPSRDKNQYNPGHVLVFVNYEYDEIKILGIRNSSTKLALFGVFIYAASFIGSYLRRRPA